MARKANVKDLFNVARLLNVLDMKDDLICIYEEKGTIQEKGFNVIFKIIDKATQQETEKRVYEVLSGPFEMKPADVGDLDLDTLTELCEQCFTFKTLLNFIKRVGN